MVDFSFIQYYIDREIYLFLLDERIRTYQSFTFLDSRPAVINGAVIKLNKNTMFEIHIYNFKYLIPFNINFNWDKELFIKKK